jgi:regulatory protein
MTDQFQILLDKARRFCDYQERYRNEVIEKLTGLEAEKSDILKIIELLEQENLLNELRYARAFAKGKLRSNKWGRNKIKAALQIKRIKPELIQKAFEEMDEDEYLSILQHIIETKQVKASNERLEKAKKAQYAIQKGFESGLVWEVVNRKL